MRVKVVKNKAGSGKGVVLSTAADAWRREGYEVIGTAIAGATAERLGADAKLERAVNTSALLAQLDSGRTTLGPNTVVVMDEAGMADTNRLAELMHATARASWCSSGSHRLSPQAGARPLLDAKR